MVELRLSERGDWSFRSHHRQIACLGAVALGASILERHFTDKMSRPGPDIVCSMDEKAPRLIESSAKLRTELGWN